MPAEHFAAPPAVKADYEVAAVGAVDGDCGGAWCGSLGGLTDPCEGSVDDGDKVWEIAWGNGVVRDVAADNLGDETGVDRLRSAPESLNLS